jgi:hypothetical protein
MALQAAWKTSSLHLALSLMLPANCCRNTPWYSSLVIPPLPWTPPPETRAANPVNSTLTVGVDQTGSGSCRRDVGQIAPYISGQ